MTGRRAASKSSERTVAVAILAIGTVASLASLLGGVWVVRAGIVVAGAAGNGGNDANRLAEEGVRAWRKASEAKEQIRTSSQQSAEISQVISEIASQTNLLALNAAIELHHHGILEKYGVELIGANFEAINKGEDRQIVPSPKVRTYDLKPEMSAREVAGVVLERLDSDKYDVMVINFANPDMVGHTGDLAAAIQAAETVDECVGKILDKIKSMGGAVIVTADHGNFEKMIDGNPDSPHTAHTVGDVPLIVFDDEYKGRTLREGGTLADIGPTMLQIMGLPQPAEMTGRSLLQGA